MREITTGWERGGPIQEGWTRSNTAVDRVGTTLNLDSGGNGGSWALRNNSSSENEATTPQFLTGANREGWIRGYMFLDSTSRNW